MDIVVINNQYFNDLIITNLDILDEMWRGTSREYSAKSLSQFQFSHIYNIAYNFLHISTCHEFEKIISLSAALNQFLTHQDLS